MSAVMPLVLFALAGVLLGGAISLRRQQAGRGVVVVVGALAAIAALGGVLWLLPGSG